jgi:hypothetical protein
MGEKVYVSSTPCICENLPTTNLALNLSIVPSNLVFILKTCLDVIGILPLEE